MKMSSRIMHALRSLRLLAMLEHSPKYARQIVRIAPDLFFADDAVPASRRKAVTAHIYVTLDRLERDELVKRAPRYTPPESSDLPKGRRIVWWTLTPKGRRALREAREAMKVYIGE